MHEPDDPGDVVSEAVGAAGGEGEAFLGHGPTLVTFRTG